MAISKLFNKIKTYFKKIEPSVFVGDKTQEVKYIVTDPLPKQNVKVESRTGELSEEDLLDTMEVLPIDQIEANILSLVIALNKFPGIYTTESCGGHKEPKVGQMAENSWMVICKFKLNDISGLHSLEHLTYVFNTFLFSAGEKVSLNLYSREPNILEPGSKLMFMIKGEDVPPDLIASMLLDVLTCSIENINT